MHIFLLLRPENLKSKHMHYFTRLENTIKANWDGIALANFKGEAFTFGELAKQIARFHVFFEAAGFKKGDKVALCAKNSARWGITFLQQIHMRLFLYLSLRISIRKV